MREESLPGTLTLAPSWVSWQLSLDKELIDFGSYVVGETTSRIITLTNIGGLGTRFKFVRASESYEMDLSQSVMKIVSILPVLIMSRGCSPRGRREASSHPTQSCEYKTDMTGKNLST